MRAFKSLLTDVKACTLCKESLLDGVRPVLQIHPAARILIAGQAPGRKVHESGVPFSDASGERLREWMNISSEVFYDAKQIAILPMGFCFPGSGKAGDLPPRVECEPAWRARLLKELPDITLTIVLGQYAQRYHFGKNSGTVTELVKAWHRYWPDRVPLPHPSPRNNIWLKKNPWFEIELLPVLQKMIAKVLSSR